MTAPSLESRTTAIARAWGVTIDRQIETATSTIAFGTRGGEGVVLKVVKDRGDEWRSGEVASAFDGQGAARVFEYTEGALLVERLDPGEPLAVLSIRGRDDEATDILCEIIAAMGASRRLAAYPTVHDWGRGFERYVESGDTRVPGELVSTASRHFAELAESQRSVRLLHGDLHHYNVLSDRRRGWAAIDPKGVIGEVEYEIGAALRNPNERPELFTDRAVIARRIDRFAERLSLDRGRVVGWGFAQAVLSAIWEIEDGVWTRSDSPVLQLATTLSAMLVGR